MATAGLRLLLRAANRRLPQWPLQHARPSQARPLAPAHVAGRSYASTPNTDGGKPGACVCALSAVVCVPYSVAAQLCAPVAGSSLHEWQPARARGGAGRQDAPLVLARPLRARVWPGVALNQHARTHARTCARAHEKCPFARAHNLATPPRRLASAPHAHAAVSRDGLEDIGYHQPTVILPPGSGEAVAPKPAPASALVEHLKARIQVVGPMSVADYIREVLTSPVAG